MIPTNNGLSIIVIVNRDMEDEETNIDQKTIKCAILVYRLSFSGQMTGLQVSIIMSTIII
jgi:hypothetical protein